MTKLFSYYFAVCLLLTISCTPKLTSGIYKGTELITVQSDNRLWPGVFKPDTNIDKSGNQWFHDVTIKIKRDSATIFKIPFFIKDGQKKYSNSIGGFYYYKGDIEYDKKDKTFNIFCSLDSCVYCPTLATATPLYSYESYEIQKDRRTLIVKTKYQKNLVFIRQ